MQKQVFLVYNPGSGSMRGKNGFQRIVRLLEEEGFSVKCADLQTIEALKPLVGNSDALAIAGGDGTVNAVASLLLNEGIENPPPLAIFPGGTANDLFRQIYRNRTAGDIPALIREGRTAALDIGRINDSYFVNVAAAGMFVDVAYLTPGRVKRLLGKPAYYLHALVKLFTYRSFKLIIETEIESREEKVLLFSVLNGSKAGGLFTVAPGAALNDGKLHLLAIKKGLTAARMVNILYRAMRGTALDLPGVINLSATEFKLHFPDDRQTVIDGEVGPPPPLQIKMLPGRLPFYTPGPDPEF